jgi:transcriptional regulator with PAS, ATPase and Fis domain
VNPSDALAALAQVVEATRRSRDPSQTAGAILGLAIAVSRSSSGFLAEVDGDGLRAVLAADATGEPLTLEPKQLQRVSVGVREALDGVAEAPPEMTGGRAPDGAIAIKAEAGRPPVHAFPIVDATTDTWEGVLGLVPDPTAPIDPKQTTAYVLTVLRNLVDPWVLTGDDRETEPATDTAGKSGSPFKYDYASFVTRSPKLFAIFKKLDRVTGASVPVLITGETGTGKELIARALHDNDPGRRKKRFYSQNCGAMPATLLESELFGYMPGAFTGAEKRKLGLFEVASGSTLFLDEIGETSLDMQTRLLRVLQEGEITPVGASVPLKVDVRIVAATLRDLEADVADGRFRQDLYYRLKVVRLRLPPLRDRPEDIELLVNHFLRKASRAIGRKPKVLDRRDPRIIECFRSYSWPGNVRELENTIQRLAYLADDVISFDALGEERLLMGEAESLPARPVRSLDDVVEEVERSEIDNALRQTDGNRTRAAELLGINRRSLLRRLKKYGLASEE